MIRLGICNELFDGWEFSQVCRTVKALGYEGLEIAPFTLAPRITDLTANRRGELRAWSRTRAWRRSACTGCWRRPRDSISLRPIPTLAVGPPTTWLPWPRRRGTWGVRSWFSVLPNSAISCRESLTTRLPDTPWRFSAASCPPSGRRALISASSRWRPQRPVSSTPVPRPVRLIDQVNHPHFKLHMDVKAQSGEIGTTVPELIRQHACRRRPLSRPRREPAGSRHGQRRFRTDPEGTCEIRLRSLGIGRSLRLLSRRRGNRAAEHRMSAAGAVNKCSSCWIGECFESPLPDVAVVPAVSQIPAHVRGQQPVHPAVQRAVGTGPNHQVEVCGHQARIASVDHVIAVSTGQGPGNRGMEERHSEQLTRPGILNFLNSPVIRRDQCHVQGLATTTTGSSGVGGTPRYAIRLRCLASRQRIGEKKGTRWKFPHRSLLDGLAS